MNEPTLMSSDEAADEQQAINFVSAISNLSRNDFQVFYRYILGVAKIQQLDDIDRSQQFIDLI